MMRGPPSALLLFLLPSWSMVLVAAVVVAALSTTEPGLERPKAGRNPKTKPVNPEALAALDLRMPEARIPP